MNQHGKNSSLLWQTIHALKGYFFLFWFCNAIYLLFLTDAYRGYGFLAQTFLAVRDGLFTLPFVLFQVVQAVLSFAIGTNNELTRQLGRSPWGIEVGGDWLSSTGVLLPVLISAALLSAVQFLSWRVLRKWGATILWRVPGLPDITQAKLKLLFWAISWLAFVLLCLFALRSGFVVCIVIGIVLLIIMRFPVLAGLPLWLMDILRPDTRNSVKEKEVSSGNLSAEDQNHSRADLEQSQRDDLDTARDDASSETTAQIAGPVTDQLADAHQTFELMPETITRKTIRKQYRTLMKALHPDQQGSTERAAIINAHYDFLLQHYGWKR